MAQFLTRNQIYRMLQRELPEGVYADGSPSAFFTTASVDAKAKTLETAYSNLQRIYENQFPQSADERIDDWLVKMFGTTLGNLTLDEKRAKVIAKIRAQPRINLWEILTLVAGYLPEGKYVQIIEYCNQSQSAWVLDESALGLNTIFDLPIKFADLGVPSDQWCQFVAGLQWRLGEQQLGVNTALAPATLYVDVTNVQKQAFIYEIRIFEMALMGADLQSMEKEVIKAEPARSSHITRQNLLLSDFFLTIPVTDVDEFSKVDCITRDPSSTTGYSGLK